MTKETFTLEVLDKKVVIKHEGKKKLTKVEKQHIKGFIREDLLIDRESGFYPYANFECSWEWSLVPEQETALV